MGRSVLLQAVIVLAAYGSCF